MWVLQKAKAAFNGMITNDKFCCTRWGQLQLSWGDARYDSAAEPIPSPEKAPLTRCVRRPDGKAQRRSGGVMV